MQIQLIPIERIRLSGINPPERTQPERLRVLRESIEQMGLLMPLIVSAIDYTLIDGHRRLACLTALGYTDAPAILTETTDYSETYRTILETQERVSSKQWGYIALQGGSVPKRMQSALDHLKKIGGTALLERLQREQISPRIWDTCSAILRYCALPETAAGTILDWMIAGRRQRAARNAMVAGIAPTKLWEIIANGRELRPRW